VALPIALLAAAPGAGGGGGAVELPPPAWSEALCLDTVVERKATSDFIATLRDGRHYHSQKAYLPISPHISPYLPKGAPP